MQLNKLDSLQQTMRLHRHSQYYDILKGVAENKKEFQRRMKRK